MAAFALLETSRQTTRPQPRPRPRRPELPAAMSSLAPEEMGHIYSGLDALWERDDTAQLGMLEADPEQLESAPLSAFVVTAFAEAAPR